LCCCWIANRRGAWDSYWRGYFPRLPNDQSPTEGMEGSNPRAAQDGKWEARNRPTPDRCGPAKGLHRRPEFWPVVPFTDRQATLANEYPEARSPSSAQEDRLERRAAWDRKVWQSCVPSFP